MWTSDRKAYMQPCPSTTAPSTHSAKPTQASFTSPAAQIAQGHPSVSTQPAGSGRQLTESGSPKGLGFPFCRNLHPSWITQTSVAASHSEHGSSHATPPAPARSRAKGRYRMGGVLCFTSSATPARERGAQPAPAKHVPHDATDPSEAARRHDGPVSPPPAMTMRGETAAGPCGCATVRGPKARRYTAARPRPGPARLYQSCCLLNGARPIVARSIRAATSKR